MESFYSFMIVKPDGFKYFDRILEEIKQRKFKNVGFFAIEDFENVIKKLYYKHYLTGKKEFPENFDAYLYGVQSLYSNHGLLILIQDQRENQQSLVDDVFELKQSIREKYSSRGVAIATNMDHGRKNTLRVVGEDGCDEKIKCLGEEGFHRINLLNLVHCPDNDIETTNNELGILNRIGVIREDNILYQDTIQLLLRFKSSTVIEDFCRRRVQETEAR